MKYFLFSISFAVIIGALFVLLSPYGFEDSALAGDAFAQGFGWALGSLILGCFGLLYKENRFYGFMIASCLFSLLGLIGSMKY